jgi:hypothetical protein
MSENDIEPSSRFRAQARARTKVTQYSFTANMPRFEDRFGSGADLAERRGKSAYLARETVPAQRAIFRSWRLTGRAEQMPEMTRKTHCGNHRAEGSPCQRVASCGKSQRSAMTSSGGQHNRRRGAGAHLDDPRARRGKQTSASLTIA